MASTQDEDMYLFQSGLGATPGAFAGQDFDTFLATSPAAGFDPSNTDDFMNPHDLNTKSESRDENARSEIGLLRSSRESGSSNSSTGSPLLGRKEIIKASTISPAATQRQQTWGSDVNSLSMADTEQYYDDASMGGLDGDLDASNQEMASAFDFDTAASTPSGYDAVTMPTIKATSAHALRRAANMSHFDQAKPSQTFSGNQAQFYIGGSREASPLNAMLPQTRTNAAWTKHSPSSGLEETFNHISMNGDSPGNATFSPNMHFAGTSFNFEGDSNHTPSSFQKDISSPPSTVNLGDTSTQLTIYPTSLKSRVETQIPIKMVIHPLPQGAKKLRLPTHTVSKPKFLAKPEVDRSPDILELYVSLVCTSAMQDSTRLERALARARGQDMSAYTKPSPASSTGSQVSSKDDEEKPLNGGEVRICPGCIQRERKRASRKKQKKPEEEEMFQKDEEKRVVVFNTSEIKDWVEVTKDNQPSSDQPATPPPGSMQVELPMRIACYCRHQNEKMGFQVIFTIKDYRDKVIAQAMTNSIMITDDHKTHNVPSGSHNLQQNASANQTQLPGAGVFSSTGMDMQHHAHNAKMFRQSFSTNDLHNLQHNFNPHFPMTPTSNGFTLSGPASAATSGTMTPRILSRPASPTGPTGPNTKRRKQSGSGKLPSGLTMTRLDTSHMQNGSSTMPNTAASSPYANGMQSFLPSNDRLQLHAARAHGHGTSPPTPNGNEAAFAAAVNRSFGLENLPRQALVSAPGSRQPSRPSSPRVASNRNSFGATDNNFNSAVNGSVMSGGHPSQRPRPIIHKVVPAEGSVTGGTEVTLLGNGFYQGLEVMFGDTEATTTTFWGEKCLNCIAPPSAQPGAVAVVFKHEHPQYGGMSQTSQTRHSIFTYVDDREVEMLRLALRTIGKQMQHPTDDPYAAAQQLLQHNQPQQPMWPQQGGYTLASTPNTGLSTLKSQSSNLQLLEAQILSMLRHAQSTLSDMPSELEQTTVHGLTLLHLSSSLGLGELVSALLSAGANTHAKDITGHTSLQHAERHEHHQVVEVLKPSRVHHPIRPFRPILAREARRQDLTDSPAEPPAYDDLFPDTNEAAGTSDRKKSSTMQMILEATTHLFLERKDDHQSSQVASPTIQRVDLLNDRKMFFFWIPIALLFLAFWFHSVTILGAVSGISFGIQDILRRMQAAIS